MPINFLAFSYKIPSEPSKNRVYIWRALKDLGAIYLQQGVALLPNLEHTLTKLTKLDSLVKESLQGKSTLSTLQFINKVDEDAIILEFVTQSNNEYDEFIKNCKLLIYELDMESSENNFTFSELEEGEENLKKLKAWIKKINTRNYFNCANYSDATLILEKAESKVLEYATSVYEKENL